MIKKESKEIVDELKNKKKLISLRLENLEKQETTITERADKLKEEIMGSLNSEKKE